MKPKFSQREATLFAIKFVNKTRNQKQARYRRMSTKWRMVGMLTPYYKRAAGQLSFWVDVQPAKIRVGKSLDTVRVA